MKSVAFALVAAACFVAAPAFATLGEKELSLGATGGSIVSPALGWAGLEARGLYDLSDFWAIGAAFHNRFVLAEAPVGVETVSFEARYVLDALQWIPSISAGFGGGIIHSSNSGGVWWSSIMLGLDYRPTRTWGVGMRLGAEGFSSHGRVFQAWVIGFCWNGYGGQGIGLDL